MQVTYQCGMRQFKEHVCFDHPGYAGHWAKHWASRRLPEDIMLVQIRNVHDLFEFRQLLKIPKEIEINTGGKYAKIVNYLF